MRLVILRCGTDLKLSFPPTAELFDVSAVPGRRELNPLNVITAEILPVDPTPSLTDIAQQPDVSHLGTPTFAPQPIDEPLRVVVIGSDAALSAVLTRLMRADTMWAEIGFVPTDSHSNAAQHWGLSELSAQEQLDFAATGRIHPLPVIRDDSATVVAGTATVTDWDNKEITAEIIVDDDVLLRHQSGRRIPRYGIFGAKLVPMFDAPGIAAAVLDSPLSRSAKKWWQRSPLPTATTDPDTVHTGRALQAGGETLRVTIDGVSRKRAVERVTFYRHLRDLQAVRKI